MKTINFLRVAIILVGILLSACAPAAPANVGGGKSLSDVIFTGVIESMDGNQWVINGQSIMVDSSVLRDGPFTVGDTVKVEATVAGDGSVTAQRVELPSAADAVETSTSAPDDSLSTPDVSSTPQAGSTPQAPVFDENGNEAFGTVDAITATSITINGQTFTFAPGVEIQGDIVMGASVKLHFMTNPDGTLSVTEVSIDAGEVHHSVTEDSHDDHGGDRSTGDDSNDDANDDRGGDSDSGSDDSGGNSGKGG